MNATLVQAHSLGFSPSATHAQNSCRPLCLSPVVKPKRKLGLKSTVSLNKKWLIIQSSLSAYCTIVSMSQIPINLPHSSLFSSTYNSNILQCTTLSSSIDPARGCCQKWKTSSYDAELSMCIEKPFSNKCPCEIEILNTFTIEWPCGFTS